VTGTFKKFDGTLVSDNENFEGADAQFSLSVDSIDTNVADRDSHLKSDDFFSSDTYPSITFTDGKLKKSGSDYQLEGELKIRDVSKKVTLNVELGGIMVDPYGQTKAGFEISGKINRKEFGLTWSAVTEAGGVVVGDDITLSLNIQLIKG
jgi:polyisoprenoid-binding protein YceI